MISQCYLNIESWKYMYLPLLLFSFVRVFRLGSDTITSLPPSVTLSSSFWQISHLRTRFSSCSLCRTSVSKRLDISSIRDSSFTNVLDRSRIFAVQSLSPIAPVWPSSKVTKKRQSRRHRQAISDVTVQYTHQRAYHWWTSLNVFRFTFICMAANAYQYTYLRSCSKSTIM